MANLILIKQGLEQGREYCGYCGKDVTGAKECMHVATGFVDTGYNYTAGTEGLVKHQKYLDGLRSMRIGEEYLMYPEELETLPMFDKVSKYGATYNMQLMFELNSLLEAGLIKSLYSTFRIYWRSNP